MASVFTYARLGQNGRLGNQLFQIAGTVGIALLAGGRPSFNPSWEYRELFSIPDEYFQPPRKGELVLDSGGDYLQRLALFDHCADHVRKILAPSSFAKEILRVKLRTLPGLLNGVSLHVRRTDYVQMQDRFCYLPARYYEAALQRLRETGHTWERVFLFSDNIPLASAELRSIKFVAGESSKPSRLKDALTALTMPQMPYHVKLRVIKFVAAGESSKPSRLKDALTVLTMSQMPYHVISNSTFAWWGAWLSGSRAVAYPSLWGVDGYAFQERMETIIPEHWLKVEV